MSIYAQLEQAPKETTERSMSEMQHEFHPQVSRSDWDALGDLISQREKMYTKPRADQCYTLRLDIKGMSVLRQQLICNGVFPKQYSHDFAYIMQTITQKLTAQYNAAWSYTQSDEITLVVCPSNSPGFEHHRGGKVPKLVSLSAAFASAEASIMLRDIHNKQLPWYTRMMKTLFPHRYPYATPLLEFDCRMSVWDTPQDAFQVILWRSYDCGINGVSDAVRSYADRWPGKELSRNSKILMNRCTKDKLSWLNSYGHLPLPKHQAYGTLYQTIHRSHTGFNPQTHSDVEVIRKAVVPVKVNNIPWAVKNGEIKP